LIKKEKMGFPFEKKKKKRGRRVVISGGLDYHDKFPLLFSTSEIISGREELLRNIEIGFERF